MFKIPSKLTATVAGLSLLGLFPAVARVFSSVVEIFTPIARAIIELVVWFVKSFFEGLGVIFSNLSTLTVIIVAIVGSGWYFQSWDNTRVIEHALIPYKNKIMQQRMYIDKYVPANKRPKNLAVEKLDKIEPLKPFYSEWFK